MYSLRCIILSFLASSVIFVIIRQQQIQFTYKRSVRPRIQTWEPFNGTNKTLEPFNITETWEPFNSTESREPFSSTNKTWKPFNTTNSHTDWCPYATCQNSPMCTPCHRRFLLLVTYGRSGSTTLLRMLNQLPGVRLSGENNGLVNAEKDAINELYSTSPFHPNKNQGGAWSHNMIPNGAKACAIQGIFEMINPPTRDAMKSQSFDDSHTIVGFKTIRLHHLKDNLDETIQFVKDSFPCARVILNIRSNITETALSWENAFNSTNQTHLFTALQQDNASMKTMAREFGKKRARLIDFADWTNEETGIQYLNNIVYWLGFRDCKFTQLYHENYDRYGRDPTGRINVGPNCHYPENL